MTLFLRRWILKGMIIIQSLCSTFAAVIEVSENQNVTITCPLNVQYPTWTGPYGLANPINSGQIINEPGIVWVKNKDLKIEKTMLKHDGIYTCSDDGRNTKTVEVDVQYFSASAHFTTATVGNPIAYFTCTCRANPPCTVIPHLVFIFGGENDHRNHEHNVTRKGCRADPFWGKQATCSAVTVMHVYEQDNGREEMKCVFEYKNVTDYRTLYVKVNVLFPPTRVNISTEYVGSRIFLTCSTDFSNPVSSLTWTRGVFNKAFLNNKIVSGYSEHVMNADYNGKKVSQTISIVQKDIEMGEKIFCCARYQTQALCDSISLDSFLTSRGYVYKFAFTFHIGVILLIVLEICHLLPSLEMLFIKSK